MNEYNNSIEELSKGFEELQIREIVKQRSTNSMEGPRLQIMDTSSFDVNNEN